MIDIESQINALKKEVAYDTRDFTIELIVNKYKTGFEDGKNEIYVPEYQRDFVWDETRQSKMIESIILGLPIPSIFIAEDANGRFEIVDGSQRIRTLSAFLNNELELTHLKKVTTLNGMTFSKLTDSRQRKLKNTALSIIVLAETASEEMKNDLFERINKGSDILRNMEARKGIYHGPFTDFVYKECAKNEKFREMVVLSKAVKNRQEYEELIVRFFALIDLYPKYTEFSRSVGRALDEYMKLENERFSDERKKIKATAFDEMIEFVYENFYFGFSKKEGQETSRIFFEAIAVGTHFALKTIQNRALNDKIDVRFWLANKGFNRSISGEYKTHATATLKERIDYVTRETIKLANKA